MRSISVIFVLLFLSGCGFKPLYYTKVGEKTLGNVSYERIVNDVKNPRATFFLNNEIERILSTEEDKPLKYLLKVTYDVNIDDYLTQSGSIASMKKIKITLNYTVTEFEVNKEVTSGKLMDFDSFSITKSPYSDFIVEEDLTIKILLSLVQELRVQLLSKLADK